MRLDTFIDYILNQLNAKDIVAVEKAIKDSPEVAQLIGQIRDAYSGITESISSIEPSPDLAQQILCSVALPRDFSGFVKRVATFLVFILLKSARYFTESKIRILLGKKSY